jgi:hypothetical protein
LNALGTRRRRDYVAGALMIVLGVGAVIEGARYPIGSLSRMGPGFFPIALGVILALAGAAIAIGARLAEDDRAVRPRPPEWRGWIPICASIVAFVVLGEYGGLVPATFAIVFISALGDRDNTLTQAAVLGLAAVAIAIVVFWWALQLQLPLFGWGAT